MTFITLNIMLGGILPSRFSESFRGWFSGLSESHRETIWSMTAIHQDQAKETLLTPM